MCCLFCSPVYTLTAGGGSAAIKCLWYGLGGVAEGVRFKGTTPCPPVKHLQGVRGAGRVTYRPGQWYNRPPSVVQSVSTTARHLLVPSSDVVSVNGRLQLVSITVKIYLQSSYT